MKTNEVVFEMPGISNVNFDLKDHDAGKSHFEGISLRAQEGKCTIIVAADRHGQSSVAKSFKERAITPKGGTTACDSDDIYPDKLNFWIKGTMSFDVGGKHYVGKDVVLAQGHNARLRNNWWIGGPGVEVITRIKPSITSVAHQTYHSGLLPAIVIYTISVGSINTIGLGVVSV
jgi:hypothetical protein